jgi:hypothetical protein
MKDEGRAVHGYTDGGADTRMGSCRRRAVTKMRGLPQKTGRMAQNYAVMVGQALPKNLWQR